MGTVRERLYLFPVHDSTQMFWNSIKRNPRGKKDDTAVHVDEMLCDDR